MVGSICKEAQKKAHYQPEIVMITGSRNIPLTSNGKLQHEIMRQQIAVHSFPYIYCWQTSELSVFTEDRGVSHAIA
jgi:hypothetical protein